MSSGSLVPIAILGVLFLAGCSSNPFQATALYSQGYQSACASVDAHANLRTPAAANDAALYAQNVDYRAGWGAGLHCRDDVPWTG